MDRHTNHFRCAKDGILSVCGERDFIENCLPTAKL